MKHYIHCHQGIDLNKGGTVGYLSSLLDGMQRLNTFESPNHIQHSYLFPDIGPDDRLPNVPIELLKHESPFEEAYEDTYHLKFDNRQSWFHSVIPPSEALKIDIKKISSVHIHGAYNFLPVYNFLRMCGIENDVVKILTTHNPWKPALEDLFHFNKNKTPEEIERDVAKEAGYRHFLNLRDDFAFRMSDALFFPCEHSVEGYSESWPEFDSIIKDKKVYYGVTGTEAKEVTIPRAALRATYDIPDDAIVFLYLGRFIPMRGFDLYAEVAEKIIKNNKNVYFLAVGEEKEKPVIDNEQWIEVAYTTSPGDYLNMADACVMANRGSYFDLGMVEALAQGIHLIASDIGGYKYLRGKTSGVSYIEPGSASSLFDACVSFIEQDTSEHQRGKQDNLDLYQKEMTPEKFAEGYFAAIDQLYEDFDIEEPNRSIAKLNYGAPVHSGSAASGSIGDNLLINGHDTPMKELAKGNPGKALISSEKVVDDNPNSHNDRRRYAEILLIHGKKYEALAQLEMAQKLIPRNKNLKKRILKVRLGKFAFWLPDKPFK